MKKSILPFLMVFAMLISGTIILSSCTKEGPQGPAGADGNATCGQCHNLSVDLYAIIVQYSASVHGTGINFERSTSSCAPCHTHQGFIEVIQTGAMATAADIDNPTPVNCRTCHQIHATYTLADYNLTNPNPVTLWIDQEIADFGKGNQCSNCHQSRVPNPLPVPGGPDVTINSPYWGGHHGPQANMLNGTGGYEYPNGPLPYTTPTLSHRNTIDDGCITCHMATPYGAVAGGHTWNMTYEYHGHDETNVDGCTDCHTGITDFDVNGVQTEMAMLLDSLFGVLTTMGIMDSSNHAIPGTMTADEAGAILNFNMVREDRSLGVHNYEYSKALIANTLDAL